MVKGKGRGRSKSKERRGRGRSKSKGRSRSRGRNVIPPLQKGTLTEYGYHFDKTPIARHRALNKAYKAHGYAKIVRKLNAISVLNKNRDPNVTETAKEDMEWLKNKYR